MWIFLLPASQPSLSVAVQRKGKKSRERGHLDNFCFRGGFQLNRKHQITCHEVVPKDWTCSCIRKLSCDSDSSRSTLLSRLSQCSFQVYRNACKKARLAPSLWRTNWSHPPIQSLDQCCLNWSDQSTQFCHFLSQACALHHFPQHCEWRPNCCWFFRTISARWSKSWVRKIAWSTNFDSYASRVRRKFL